MNRKKFYDAKPIKTAHKFGVFDLVWVVVHEHRIEEEFPCEVCGETGSVKLKTRNQEGQIVERAENCWYCQGSKKRCHYRHEWKALGPCQVFNYQVSGYPKLPGQDVYSNDPDAVGDDKDYYLYIKYHVYTPPGYGDKKDGELDSLYPDEKEMFETEAEAKAEAERLNAEIRKKGE